MSNTFICILPQASLSSMNFNAVYIEKGLLQVAKFRYAQEARFHFSYFIFFFLSPMHYLLLFCLGFTTIINEMIRVERRTQKKI